MNLDDPTHVACDRTACVCTAFAVQGMASSFDTHGHFAVLLGLSFRHGRELTVDFGGFWGFFFNCGFHLGGFSVSLA